MTMAQKLLLVGGTGETGKEILYSSFGIRELRMQHVVYMPSYCLLILA
jgi:hypothetical protein